MICLLVDVFSKDITGKQAEKALENAGIWYGGEQKHHSLGCLFSHVDDSAWDAGISQSRDEGGRDEGDCLHHLRCARRDPR